MTMTCGMCLPICVWPKISFTVSMGTSWFIMELAIYLLKL